MRLINFTDVRWGRTSQIVLWGVLAPPFSKKSLKHCRIHHDEKEDNSFCNSVIAKFGVNVFITKPFLEIYSAMKIG